MIAACWMTPADGITPGFGGTVANKVFSDRMRIKIDLFNIYTFSFECHLDYYRRFSSNNDELSYEI